MTTDCLSPTAKSTQPFKKRKVDLDSIHVDNNENFNSKDSKIHEHLSENTDVITKCMDEESKEDLIQNVTPKNSPNRRDSINKNCVTSRTRRNTITTEETKNEAHNTEIVSNNDLKHDNVRPPVISVCKLEDLCRTPKKTFETDDKIDIETCKIENYVNNPPPVTPRSILQTNLPLSHSKSIKTLEESPVSTKKETHSFEEKTPKRTPRKKKRKISSASDYDQLSDTVKTELCESINIQDMEAIDLLHDLDNMMDFEETKISGDILLSSVAGDNNIGDNDEINSEIPKDPLADPLFIASNDEQETMSDKTVDKLFKFNNHNIYDEKAEQSILKKNADKEPFKKTIHNPEKTIFRRSKRAKEKVKDTIKIIDDILGELDFTEEERKYEEDDVEMVDEEDEEEEEDEDEDEDEEFCRDTRKKLAKLQIKLQHKVPPQHKVEQCPGTRPPNQEEKILFERHAPLKQGSFSTFEDQIITSNWKIFCRLHNWDTTDAQPFVKIRDVSYRFLIPDPEERQRFVQFLANGLPWRSLYSVYQRFKKLYEIPTNNHFRYTIQDDQQIWTFMSKKKKYRSNKKYIALAKRLGRTRRSILQRFKFLKKLAAMKRKPLSKVEWTLPMTGKFIKELLQLTLSNHTEDLKNAAIPKPVWSKLEEKMKIDQGVLKEFWIQQLHMQLFCPRPIYLNDIRIELIEYMYGKGISNTREIIWPNVAKHFEGMTTVFLCKIFFHLVRDVTGKAKSTDLVDIVEYLYSKKIPEIRDEPTDKYLPRVSYRNGKIAVIDENTNNFTNAEYNKHLAI